ncbi:hypothetical protein FRB90_012197 [Tulasnella sp. 427]|nr:hypothetical protein FRB90_012197 [Tulasnella sp. 427]
MLLRQASYKIRLRSLIGQPFELSLSPLSPSRNADQHASSSTRNSNRNSNRNNNFNSNNSNNNINSNNNNINSNNNNMPPKNSGKTVRKSTKKDAAAHPDPTADPSTSTAGPSTSTAGSSTSTAGPSTSTAGPSTSTAASSQPPRAASPTPSSTTATTNTNPTSAAAPTRSKAKRGRVPTLPLAVMRARMYDPRIDTDGTPVSEAIKNDPTILPFSEEFCENVGLSPQGMLDPEFRDIRGHAPNEHDILEFRKFFDAIKQDPGIVGENTLREIPGAKTFATWANKSWVPRVTEIVRRVLAEHGETFIQRQLKAERKHKVDLTANDVAIGRRDEIVSALFGEAGFNEDDHHTPIAGLTIVVKDVVYRVCDGESRRYRKLRPRLEEGRKLIAAAITAFADPTHVDLQQFRRSTKEASALQAIFHNLRVEAEGEDKELLDTFQEKALEVIQRHEGELNRGEGSTDFIRWTEAQIEEANAVYAEHFLTSGQVMEIPNDDALTSAVFGPGDLGNEQVKRFDKTQLYPRLGIPKDGQIPYFKPYTLTGSVPAAVPAPPLLNFQELRDWAAQYLPVEDRRPLAKSIKPIPPYRAALEEEEMERECPRTHRLVRGHVHQIQAVLAMAEQAFKTEAQAVHSASMLADGMGLGKTMTSFAYAAMVGHWRDLQEQGSPLPSHFAGKYWCGHERIPDGPTVIITPNNLMRQWASELRAFVLPTLIDILIYDPKTPAAAEKWMDDVYNKSQKVPHRRWIVTTSNAIKREGNRVLNFSRKGKGNLANPPAISAKAKRDGGKTFFNLKPNVTIIDESHQYRNLNRDAHAMLVVSTNSCHTIELTGTPVFNATLDLLAQACLLGVPEFLGANYRQKLKEIKGLMPKKRLAPSIQRDVEIRVQIAAAQATLVDTNKAAIDQLRIDWQPYIIRRTMQSFGPWGEPIVPPIPHAVISSFVALSEEEEEQLEIMCQETEAKQRERHRVFSTDSFFTPYRLSLQFPGHSSTPSENVDRILEAKNWTLPQFDEVRPSKMMRVAEILDHHIPPELRRPMNPAADVAVEDRLRTPLTWEYRSAAAAALPSRERILAAWEAENVAFVPQPVAPTTTSNDDGGNPLPAPETAPPLPAPSPPLPEPSPSQPEASTSTAQPPLASSSKAPPPVPPPPTSTTESPPPIRLVGGLRRTKVIITLQYVMYLPVLTRFLDCRGYAVRSFTGDTPLEERARIIEEFNSDDAHPADPVEGADPNAPQPHTFILIMSGIGITGLNLTRGSDQAWSQQEENQATHRIVRLGQGEYCIIYKVLAKNTTDVWMNQVASGKELMLDLFSGNINSLQLQALRRPELLNLNLDDEEQEVHDDAVLGISMLIDPSRLSPLPDDDDDDDGAAAMPPPPPPGRVDKGKQREGAPPIPPPPPRTPTPSPAPSPPRQEPAGMDLDTEPLPVPTVGDMLGPAPAHLSPRRESTEPVERAAVRESTEMRELGESLPPISPRVAAPDPFQLRSESPLTEMDVDEEQQPTVAAGSKRNPSGSPATTPPKAKRRAPAKSKGKKTKPVEDDDDDEAEDPAGPSRPSRPTRSRDRKKAPAKTRARGPRPEEDSDSGEDGGSTSITMGQYAEDQARKTHGRK